MPATDEDRVTLVQRFQISNDALVDALDSVDHRSGALPDLTAMTDRARDAALALVGRVAGVHRIEQRVAVPMVLGPTGWHLDRLDDPQSLDGDGPSNEDCEHGQEGDSVEEEEALLDECQMLKEAATYAPLPTIDGLTTLLTPLADGQEVTPLTPVPVEGISHDTLAQALGAAHDAFWQTLVAHFPEVQTGDMDPIETHLIESAMARAAAAWLILNRPLPEYESQPSFPPADPDEELDIDTVTWLGLDGTGRDLDPRFPYTWSNLTDEERARVLDHPNSQRYLDQMSSTQPDKET